MGELTACGVERAGEVRVRPIKFDELDRHVMPNSGPLIIRGVWYPCHNLGFGAPH